MSTLSSTTFYGLEIPEGRLDADLVFALLIGVQGLESVVQIEGGRREREVKWRAKGCKRRRYRAWSILARAGMLGHKRGVVESHEDS